MEYQRRDMRTADVVSAIEAIGYNLECRNITKHINRTHRILLKSFHRNIKPKTDFFGSIAEGVELIDNYKYTDVDIVRNYTEMSMYHKETEIKVVSAEKDFSIIPFRYIPGYVLLKLHEPILNNHCIPNTIFDANSEKDNPDTYFKVEQNGPAFTLHEQYNIKHDEIICFMYKAWPAVAKKWAKRNKPNDWPSKELMKKIMLEGFNLAPVGHKDLDEKHKTLQWRIGIRGEKLLVLTLNETQILSYVALRLILKLDIKKRINEDVLSSFHMKNVVFWSIEQDSCQWTKDNFETCFKICINRLVEFIRSRRLPHYFIQDRNLINLTMTSEKAEQILKAICRYRDDISAILTLDIFDDLRKSTNNFNGEEVERAKQRKIITYLIQCYEVSFMSLVNPQNLWGSYTGHNTATNLQNAEYILSVLTNREWNFMRHYIAYANNMLGLLYYSRYNETHCQNEKLKAMEVLKSSLTIENISLKFRVATFFFMENEFKECLSICDAFLRIPCKCILTDKKLDSVVKVRMILKNIFSKCYTLGCFSDTVELKEKILELFDDKSVLGTYKCGDERLQQADRVINLFNNSNDNDVLIRELKSSYGTALDAFLLVFKNYGNLAFRDMSFNVPYLASEKWAVPEVIQYELLSVKSYHPGSNVYGIYIDPMLNCLVLKYLCFQKTNLLTQRDELLTEMNKYIEEYSCGKKAVQSEHPHSLPIYRVLNIVAYCCGKAGRYQNASTLIRRSFDHFPSEENTAHAYIRCVCGILSSLYDSDEIVYKRTTQQ